MKAVDHKFPGPGNGLVLKIIADAEIAQHFEKSQVLGIAHRLNIRGAEALLAGGQTAVGRCLYLPGNSVLNCTMPAVVKSRVGSL